MVGRPMRHLRSLARRFTAAVFGEGASARAWVGLTLLAPLLCFVLGSVYVASLSEEIGAASLSIAANGGPSVVYLSAMRNDVRRIEQRAMLVRPGSAAETRAIVAELMGALAGADVAYRALPSYPGELALSAVMERRRAPFLAVATGLIDRADQGLLPSDEALLQLRAAAENLSDAIGAVIQLNADQVEQAGSTIARLRERMLLLSVARDALAFAFVVVGTTLGLRTWRREAALAEERRRLDHDRVAELDVFAGRVAHDLRDLLGVILMRASLGERAQTLEAATDALARITRQSHRMSATIDALLAFARAAARPAPGARSDAAAVVQEVAADARLLAGEARADIEVEPLRAAVIACDPVVLGVVLANLVRNAVKYAGGRRITLRGYRWRSRLFRFEVEDSGPGLPPGAEGRIFEPFVRLERDARVEDGIGLGLATVKRLVEANGGEVGVESRPGVGCRFWFTLPLAPELV